MTLQQALVVAAVVVAGTQGVMEVAQEESDTAVHSPYNQFQGHNSKTPSPLRHHHKCRQRRKLDCPRINHCSPLEAESAAVMEAVERVVAREEGVMVVVATVVEEKVAEGKEVVVTVGAALAVVSEVGTVEGRVAGKEEEGREEAQVVEVRAEAMEERLMFRRRSISLYTAHRRWHKLEASPEHHEEHYAGHCRADTPPRPTHTHHQTHTRCPWQPTAHPAYKDERHVHGKRLTRSAKTTKVGSRCAESSLYTRRHWWASMFYTKGRTKECRERLHHRH